MTVASAFVSNPQLLPRKITRRQRTLAILNTRYELHSSPTEFHSRRTHLEMMTTDSKSLKRRNRFMESAPANAKVFSSFSQSSIQSTGLRGNDQEKEDGNSCDRKGTDTFSWTEFLSLSSAVNSAGLITSAAATFATSTTSMVASNNRRTASLEEYSSTAIFSQHQSLIYGGAVAIKIPGQNVKENVSTKNMVASSSHSEERLKSSPPHGPQVNLTPEEKELFDLLARVVDEGNIPTTLRVAGGWVRDKLLATEEFNGHSCVSSELERLTSKQQSKGRKGSGTFGSQTNSVNGLMDDQISQPVDIDIALDDMLGREFADHLNEWLSTHGRKTVSVGVVLKNPEKSKHLETATMKVNQFWIDFVNLRAEEYAGDSRIPDLMRIGTAEEDSFRRDLTINSLFYNINTGCVEDFTGRGLEDLKKRVVATPLPPLTTLLDDPLRVLRSVRFAARLRFSMDEKLREAARDERVREALAMKVSRERVGGEVDLMLRSLDPVGAMRLLINLELASTVFPVANSDISTADVDDSLQLERHKQDIFYQGQALLSTTHDYLCDCKLRPPLWCKKKRAANTVTYGFDEPMLMDSEESRRLLWYASFLKPLRDKSILVAPPDDPDNKKGRRQGKKAHQSAVMKLMIDELKRPTRDAQEVERIQKAADDFTNLIAIGGDLSATAVLLSGIRVAYHENSFDEDDDDDVTCTFTCKMTVAGSSSPVCVIEPETETDPVWLHAMEFRLFCSRIMLRIGERWRAALVLSLSEQLLALNDDNDVDYAIEGDVVEQMNENMRQSLIIKYDTLAAAMQELGIIGIWNQKPLIDGGDMKQNHLRNIPKGPVFRDVMDEQNDWMIKHPGGGHDALVEHLKQVFPDYV